MKTKLSIVALLLLACIAAQAQDKIDQARMERDVEVAENVLNTLLKQKAEKQRGLFPIRVEGEYVVGQGVTFKIPSHFNPFFLEGPGNFNWYSDGDDGNRKNYSFSFSDEPQRHIEIPNEEEINAEVDRAMKHAEEAISDAEQEREMADRHRDIAEKQIERANRVVKKIVKKQEKIARKNDKKSAEENEDEEDYEDEEAAEENEDIVIHQDGKHNTHIIHGKMSPISPLPPMNFGDGQKWRKPMNQDSLQEVNNTRIVNASKDFIADYGNLLTQLNKSEKIIITTRRDRPFHMGNEKQKIVTVEVLAGDVDQYKKGKISREQLLNKIKVVNAEVSNEAQPDLELLQTIFNRLYRSDLSKTYFCNSVRYEKIDGIGATFYMKTFSSNQNDDLFDLPTVDKKNVSKAEREKIVKDLYPAFEKGLQNDMLEYGRTVKSLKENESLLFKVTVTKCDGCGIPAQVDFSIKQPVLSDYASGKISLEEARKKMVITKGKLQ